MAVASCAGPAMLRVSSAELAPDEREEFRTHAELEAHIATLHTQMKAAAANLEFEKAATLRDRIKQLRSRELGLAGSRR